MCNLYDRKLIQLSRITTAQETNEEDEEDADEEKNPEKGRNQYLIQNSKFIVDLCPPFGDLGLILRLIVLLFSMLGEPGVFFEFVAQLSVLVGPHYSLIPGQWQPRGRQCNVTYFMEDPWRTPSSSSSPCGERRASSSFAMRGRLNL